MCLAQGQNTALQVRLEPASLRVKHSTTEPQHSRFGSELSYTE